MKKSRLIFNGLPEFEFTEMTESFFDFSLPLDISLQSIAEKSLIKFSLSAK
jgi:hypothetical protein